ncbi:MAG TPA: hypothetical protein VEC36_06300 [Patescibacteria group bacterium]|nr:hypothetical protein [Patescibacteria group bacterium]
MQNLFKTVVVVGLLILPMDIVAQGRNVTIFLKNSTQRRGELLLVRDSIVAVLTSNVENTNEIVLYPERIEFAALSDIQRIRIHETNVEGAIPGSLIGGGAGALFGLGTSGLTTKNTVPYIFENFAIGAISGLIIGWVVATSKSDEEKTFWPSEKNPLIKIKYYARFDSVEPRFIGDFIDELLKISK